MTETTLLIINAIKAIPEGKVASYGSIAARAGLPNGARQVSRALHSLSEKYHLPWHRVIKADGSIALKQGEGRELQAKLLEREGIPVSEKGVIDMNAFRWKW